MKVVIVDHPKICLLYTSFLELVSSDEGMNIGMRHISVSTCGIVDKIYDMASRKLQCTLSVSLHAPNDNLRSQTMPINKKWGVAQLLKACKYYSDTTRRRISFEYAMISGLNEDVYKRQATDSGAGDISKNRRFL